MDTLTLEKVWQNPVAFVRLFVPVCMVLEEQSAGRLSPVFEFLTKPDALVKERICTQMEVDETLEELKKLGYTPVTLDTDAQELAQELDWRLEGSVLMKREYPVDDMMWSLRFAAFTNHKRFRQVIEATEHYINCHIHQKMDNRP